MRNSILFILLFMLLFSCEKQEYSVVNTPRDFSGEATVIRSATIDYNQLNGAEFPLVLETYYVDTLKISHDSPPPGINFLNGSNVAFMLNENVASPYHSFEVDSSVQTPHHHLLICNTELDKLMMYHASTGFFLEQYKSKLAGNQFSLGYYNAGTNKIEIDTSLLTFYEKSDIDKLDPKVDPANSYNKNLSQTHLISSIKEGISYLQTTSSVKKQLTILNYSLIDTNGLIQNDLDQIAADLTTHNISLNIISLFQINFIQPIVFQSGGFYSADIPFIENKSNFINNPLELDVLLEKRSFPSSYVIQNLDKLLRKSKLRFQRYVIPCRYENQLAIADTLSVFKSTIFRLDWEASKPYLYPIINIKPYIKE